MKATLTIEIEFNPSITDADAIGVAVDHMLATAMSTPGILEEYGDPEEFGIGQTYVQHPRVPLLMKYVANGEDDELSDDAFLGTVADRIQDDLEASPALDAQRIQFARIIWEMDAACQDRGMLDDMAESMDLEPAELQELIATAIKVFEKAKERATGAVLEL